MFCLIIFSFFYFSFFAFDCKHTVYKYHSIMKYISVSCMITQNFYMLICRMYSNGNLR